MAQTEPRFSETMWFKLGGADDSAAVAALSRPATDEVELEERYVDSGLLSIDDKRAYSLNTARPLTAEETQFLDRYSDEDLERYMVTEVVPRRRRIGVVVGIAVFAISVAASALPSSTVANSVEEIARIERPVTAAPAMAPHNVVAPVPVVAPQPEPEPAPAPEKAAAAAATTDVVHVRDERRVERVPAKRAKRGESKRAKRAKAKRLKRAKAKRLKRAKAKRLERAKAKRLKRAKAKRLKRAKAKRLKRAKAKRAKRAKAKRDKERRKRKRRARRRKG